MARGRRTLRPAHARKVFCEVLTESCNVTAACEAAGIGRTTAYDWKAEDEAFSTAWDAAIESAVDKAETEAFRRALHGNERPVIRGGQVVATFHEYSDRLLELILKGRRRAVYGDKQEISGPGGGPVVFKTIYEQAPKHRLDLVAERVSKPVEAIS